MQDCGCNHFMQMMNLPSQYYPMVEMPQEQLEAMYPRTYHIVYPHVRSHCDQFDGKYGMMYNPTREQLEAMTDDIYRRVEADVEAEANQPREGKDRQLGLGGRRILRDLVSILLIRELLGRRRPFFGGFPGYGFGYGGYGYGGYPAGPAGFGGYGGYGYY